MSDDLSGALADSSYKLTDKAKAGDVVHFTVVSAGIEDFQDFNDKDKINKRIVLRVREDVRKVKLGKASGERCIAAWGAKASTWAGKKVRGVVTKMGTGALFLDFEPGE